jgi:hypothetical protein
VAQAPAVIAGFGGELISHAYVEQRLLAGADGPRLIGFDRELLRWWRRVSRSLGPASSVRAIHDVASIPLLRLLEYDWPSATPDTFGVRAPLPDARGVLLSIPWSASTASIWGDAIRQGLAAHASWALVSNGRSLRIIDCARSWTRAAIEFEFERLTTSPKGVAALWHLARAGGLGANGEGSLRAHVSASDSHASAVCRSLSDGVLAVLPSLAEALACRGPAARDRSAAFDQALTLVYRILFLLFAEARALVPVWNDLYRDAYTIAKLIDRVDNNAFRPRSERDGFSGRFGLWETLQAISRLAHAGCSAGDLQVTAFNGRLFSPRHAPLVDRRRVPDAVIREVLLLLGTESNKTGRRRVSYHDLGVEQLGSVYERVLEYQPSRHGRLLERTSTLRKSTGSFYTPRALTEFLVSRTLAPLVENRTAEQILELRVLDPAMGSGAFLVAACRYLADCCEHAMVRDGRWAGLVDHSRARATLRRSVAERCLYGVDLNPTAVQLARLSLWLTTLAADRPLTFLDHHLAAGDSLIGAWLADLSRAPGSPRASRAPAPLPLLDEGMAGDVAVRVLPERIRMAIEPSDSVGAVRIKERALAALAGEDGPMGKWHAAADAWCAAALWPGPSPSPGVVAEWIAAASGTATTLPSAQLTAALERARALAGGHAAFHWELAFPEIFFDAAGRQHASAGFDAVVGNPPWDMLRADSGSAAERRTARPRSSSALNFFRRSGAYRRQGTGHPNRYQLFLERALQLTRPGGRIGLLLPSGVATDHGSASLRRHLLDRTAIDTWIGFDNRRRIFPVHRSVRFVLMSTTNAGATEALRFRCGVTDPAVLHRDDPGQTLTLARSRIEALSPDHLTIPEVTSPVALGILTAVAERVPPLADPSGWNARFGRELNATDDRPHFVALIDGGRSMLPIVEGKQLAPFQVDVGRSAFGIPIAAAARVVDGAATFERERIAYRDVASATNKLTLIAAMLPRGTISTHTIFCLKTVLPDDDQWCLLGLLNSLVANYLVRLQVTTHVTTSLMSRLPVPVPSPHLRKQLADLSRRLSASGVTDQSTQYATLNAITARLYGLSIEEYTSILDSFPLIPKTQRDCCLSVYSSNNSHRT